MTLLLKEQELNIIERARVKHIEGLSRTFDHVRGKCVKGFANLLIC